MARVNKSTKPKVTHTYNSHKLAHYVNNPRVVIIPDEVASDPRAWIEAGNKPFPAYVKGEGRLVRVRLDPDAYALTLPDAGYAVVNSA